MVQGPSARPWGRVSKKIPVMEGDKLACCMHGSSTGLDGCPSSLLKEGEHIFTVMKARRVLADWLRHGIIKPKRIDQF